MTKRDANWKQTYNDESNDLSMYLDEFVYECISDWDKYFEEGDDWFNEEDTDMKDTLREQVLEYVERLLEEETKETSS